MIIFSKKKKVLLKTTFFANEKHNPSKNKAVASQVVLLSFPTENKQDALLRFPYFSSFTVVPYPSPPSWPEASSDGATSMRSYREMKTLPSPPRFGHRIWKEEKLKLRCWDFYPYSDIQRKDGRKKRGPRVLQLEFTVYKNFQIKYQGRAAEKS